MRIESRVPYIIRTMQPEIRTGLPAGGQKTVNSGTDTHEAGQKVVIPKPICDAIYNYSGITV